MMKIIFIVEDDNEAISLLDKLILGFIYRDYNSKFNNMIIEIRDKERLIARTE